VPINRELTVSATIERTHGRRIHTRGELREGDTLLADARGAFLHVALEHFLATPEGQAAREHWERRLPQ
jgi:acyl-CoA thioesterase FadM